MIDEIYTDDLHCSCINSGVVETVCKDLESDDELMNTAELFSIFADYTRVKIINALLLHEMCVCDIAAVLNMTNSAVSHQLAVLKHAHIVNTRKDGKVRYYSLSDDHIEKLFLTALEHINE